MNDRLNLNKRYLVSPCLPLLETKMKRGVARGPEAPATQKAVAIHVPIVLGTGFVMLILHSKCQYECFVTLHCNYSADVCF